MSEHYFTKNPTSQSCEQEITFDNLTFSTTSGLFSKDHVDIGTQVLLEGMQVQEKVLDLGCGYGVIGIYVKKKYPHCTVTCVDINQRAIAYTKKNAKKNSVDITAIQSDGYENITDTFDTILLNPPQHAGQDVCFSLIKNSKDHLRDGGNIQIVIRSSKGGKAYTQFLKELYNNVEVIYKRSGFRVLKSLKQS